MQSGANKTGRRKRLSDLLQEPGLRTRFDTVREISGRVRSSEYHLTNACNIRCDGCWFFAKDFDQRTSEPVNIERWRLFAKEQASGGVTAALLIGGEPTLYPERIEAFQDAMDFVTVSSNGLRGLPRDGFEDVAVALTLFAGVGEDDRLRAIAPSGKRFDGLFDTALKNYRNDPRATFIYALDARSPDLVDETVARIQDNGNVVSFNYYSDYGRGADRGPAAEAELRLLDEVLRVTARYPETVISHPYYSRALIRGRTEWGTFGYEECPSISVSHPEHAERLTNGKPVLPGFNAYSADTESVTFCCTSGDCSSCRDSQAVHSWLMVSVREFIRQEDVRTWIEVSESYWEQFVWSPLHRTRRHEQQ